MHKYIDKNILIMLQINNIVVFDYEIQNSKNSKGTGYDTPTIK